MPRFADDYSEQQREACVLARLSHTAPEAARMAARGELVDLYDRRVPPFEVPASTIRSFVRAARKAAEPEASKTRPYRELEHRDAVEVVRQELAGLCEGEIRRLKRAQRKGQPIRGEELRQLGRAAREFAALPGPNDPRPIQPGQKIPGTGTNAGGATRGGIATTALGASVLAANRGEGSVPIEEYDYDALAPEPSTPPEPPAPPAPTPAPEGDEIDAWLREEVE